MCLTILTNMADKNLWILLMILMIMVFIPLICIRHLLEYQKNFQQQAMAIKGGKGEKHHAIKRARTTRTMDWTMVFSFLPDRVTTCNDLFPSVDKRQPFPRDFFLDYVEFLKKFRNTTSRAEGHTGKHIEETLVYYHLVQAPFIRTVCETGFNAGHSTFMWLRANHRTRVYSFDIGVHKYAGVMASYLKKRFPGRLHVTWGDSSQTLPIFLKENPDVKCDLLVIDGGHTTSMCDADYKAFKLMANVDNIIVLDDYPGSDALGVVWENGKRNGEIIEVFQCLYIPTTGLWDHGFSIGRLNMPFIQKSMKSRKIH